MVKATNGGKLVVWKLAFRPLVAGGLDLGNVYCYSAIGHHKVWKKSDAPFKTFMGLLCPINSNGKWGFCSGQSLQTVVLLKSSVTTDQENLKAREQSNIRGHKNMFIFWIWLTLNWPTLGGVSRTTKKPCVTGFGTMQGTQRTGSPGFSWFLDTIWWTPGV